MAVDSHRKPTAIRPNPQSLWDNKHTPCKPRCFLYALNPCGQVAEWFKAAVLKTAVGASSPWVRIPPCPPTVLPKTSQNNGY